MANNVIVRLRPVYLYVMIEGSGSLYCLLCLDQLILSIIKLLFHYFTTGSHIFYFCKAPFLVGDHERLVSSINWN